MAKKTDPAMLATDLRVVVGRLVRRMRADYSSLPVSQATVLGRLDRGGGQSVSDLAAAEHMRPQSMAQIVIDLEAQRLIRRNPDPGDRRRALVELTGQGQATLEAERRRREGWLAEAISELPGEDRDVLARAAELLRHLAEA
jgi:DNA-binding MarR family transcriptional regulator